MKRTSLQLILFFFPVLLLTLAPLRANAVTVYPGNAVPPSINVRVNHSVQIQEGGIVLINDTIELFTRPGEFLEPLQNFSMGFPFQYGSNLDYAFAYDAMNPDAWLEVKLDVGLERIGFYGVNVIFREPIDISDGKSYNFTIVFVFSNLVSSVTESLFKLDFPLYPSLVQEASQCDAKVTLPPNANYTGSSFSEKGLDFNITTIDSRQVLNHTKSPLKDFAYEPAWIIFTKFEPFPIIDVDETRREITLDEWGQLLLSDRYYLTNKAERGFYQIKIQLPRGAYGVSARDVLGDLSVTLEGGNTTMYTNATITFRASLKKGETGNFAVTYRLPWKNYVNQDSWRDFNLTLTLSERFNWTIRKLVVSVMLPEGAEVPPSSINELINELTLHRLDFTYSVEKSVFRETVTLILYNITPFHNLDFSFSYGYLVFWASFRPTLWMGTLVIILCGIALLWKAPKPPVPVLPIPLEDLRSFVDSYDEKRRLLSELESIEQQVRKGKIPRRRYKVRKRTLEGRLSVLSRNLTALREKIRAADPRHADIMRQIEVAETELEGAETDIRRIKARYRRGEISASAYHKLLEEYHRRRDRAKTTIDGALLRLREEIR